MPDRTLWASVLGSRLCHRPSTNRSRRCLIQCLCIVTLFLVPMHAQKTSGTIRGIVSDPSGAVIPNVPVVIRNDGTGLTRTVTTNRQGEYVAPELPSGTYTISVTAPGFREGTSTDVVLHVSSTQVLNLQLQLGNTTEQVMVHASAVQVETDNAAVGEVVNGDQVQELPLNGRNFIALTQLQAGVSASESFDSKFKGLLGLTASR
jgi:hypothetical protein